MRKVKSILIIFFFALSNGGSFAQFTGPHQFVTGQPILSEGYISIVDLDNDNYPDILWSSGSSGSNVGWFQNSCSGFAPSVYIDVFSGISTSAIAADVNGDGLKDIFATFWNNNTLYKYNNLGGGSFSSRDTIASYIYHPYQLYAADIDSDGDTDIVCGGTNAVIWYENDGAGNFIAEHNVGTGTYYDGINSLDVNSDGRLDLVCGNYIYRQEANGSFTISDTLLGNDIISTQILDLDNDGDLDIIGVENHHAGNIYIYLNNNGNFERYSSIYITSSWDFWDSGIADVDGDGDVDLVACAWGGIVYLERTGSYTFDPHIVYSASYDCMDLKDIDNDGDPDIVYATDNTSGYFLNMSHVNVTFSTALTLCQGDSILIYGTYQQDIGTYYDTLSAVNGCDSIIATVLLPETNTVNISICNGDSVFFLGEYHHTQGLYYDSLTSAMGCDSITIYNLSVNNHSSSTLTITACDNFTLNGQNYNTDGIFTQVIPNSVGCDSVITLFLTIKHSSDFVYNETGCDDIIYNGVTYTSTGIYNQVLTNSVGCDSIITLNLTINRTYSNISLSVCDSATINGITYYNSGNYSQVLTNSMGCDSVISIEIEILRTNTNINEIACDSYTLNGSTYTSSGIYKQYYTNISGCDSVIILYLTIVNTVSSPNYSPSLNWAKRFGNTGYEYGYSVQIDSKNNVYVTGSYSGTVDFDPGTSIYNLTNKGGYDVFVVKLNRNGNLIWARSFGGSSDEEGHSVAIDNSGNVIVTGIFKGTVDFDPGTSVYSLTSNGDKDIFIVKLDSLGAFIWAKSFGSSYAENSGSVITDSLSNIYSTGHFTGTVDFDPSAGTFNVTASGGIYIHKLDKDGNFIWVKTFNSISTYNIGNYIDIDNDENLYVTGDFSETVDFDPGPGVYNLVSNGSLGDVFILKLSKTGNFIWAKSIGASSIDHGKCINVDNACNVYITGDFYNTVDFDPGAGSYNITSMGSTDIYILKLDSSGSFIWAKTFGSSYNPGTNTDAGQSITTDIYGNVYATGFFQSTADFDPDTNIYNVTSNGLSDIYITKFDACGNFKWVRSFGGTQHDKAYSIQVNNDEDVYTVGNFFYTVDFDPTSDVSNMTSAGVTDVFVQKLSDCTTKFNEIDIASCISYTSPSGNYIWTSDGTYYDTLLTSRGCDSVLTINLTILSNSYSSINEVACDNFLSPSHNYLWTASGTYFDTIPSASGCDSIITVNLQIKNSSINEIFVSDCNSYISPSGLYTWTLSGIYSDTLTNFLGCDSIITVHLDVLSSDTIINITSCDNYSINSQNYTSSGTYTQILNNYNGCDSIITLNLTINHTTYSTIQETSCNSFISPDGNEVWTVSGNYTDTLLNSLGCDSVISIELVIKSNTYSGLYYSTCDSFISPSGNYIWTNSGTYFDTIPNSVGCDSLITINLQVLNTESTINASACHVYNSPSGNYTWYSSGIYTDTITNLNGCDSIITINLTILNNTGIISESVCDSFELNGISYYNSGTYTQTLTNSFGCDSILTINLQVTDIDTTVILIGDSLYAVASPAQYEWYDCVLGMIISGENNQYFYPGVSGIYSAIITNNSCTDTSGCHTVIITGISNSNSEYVTCYPNPFSVYTKVSFKKLSKSVYKAVLYGVSGEIIREYDNIANEFLIIERKDLKPGLYFLELTGEKTYWCKIMIE